MRKPSVLIRKGARNLRRSGFAKNVLLIAGGTALSQAVTMAFSPLVTRIYSPEEYGVLTLFNSILGITALVGSLKYELVIPIVDDEEHAIDGVVLSFVILIVLSLVSSLSLLFFGAPILRWIGAEQLISYWYVIPIGTFLVQGYRIVTQYAYRQKNFRDISRTKAIQGIVGNLSKIASGVLGFGVIGLLFSKVLTDSVGLTTLSRPLVREKAQLRLTNLRRLKTLAARHFRFPLYQFPSTLIAQFSITLPVFFLGSTFDSQVVGAYGLANSIVRLPIGLIGNSVSSVFFAEAASIGKEKPRELKKLSDKLFRRMIIMGFAPLIALLMFAPSMFSFVFGISWLEAGNFARVLSVLVFAEFIFSPVSRVFEIFEKQKQALMLNVVTVISGIVIFGVARCVGASQYVTVLVYTIAMSFTHLVTYLMAQSFIKDAIGRVDSR